MEALVVSQETSVGLPEINKVRELKGWKPLQVILIEYVANQSDLK